MRMFRKVALGASALALALSAGSTGGGSSASPGATTPASTTAATQAADVTIKIGRPDFATEAMGINEGDTYLTLKPVSEWKRFHTKDELMARARKLGVKGRSRMTKLELGQAIARKQG